MNRIPSPLIRPPRRTPTAWWLGIGVFIAHALASVAFLLWGMRLSTDHFEGYAVSRVALTFADAGDALLTLPLTAWLQQTLPRGWQAGLGGWIPLLLNSLAWAVAAVVVLRLRRRHLRRH